MTINVSPNWVSTTTWIAHSTTTWRKRQHIKEHGRSEVTTTEKDSADAVSFAVRSGPQMAKEGDNTSLKLSTVKDRIYTAYKIHAALRADKFYMNIYIGGAYSAEKDVATFTGDHVNTLDKIT